MLDLRTRPWMYLDQFKNWYKRQSYFFLAGRA